MFEVYINGALVAIIKTERFKNTITNLLIGKGLDFEIVDISDCYIYVASNNLEVVTSSYKIEELEISLDNLINYNPEKFTKKISYWQVDITSNMVAEVLYVEKHSGDMISYNINLIPLK
jgi:hypothetical protein